MRIVVWNESDRDTVFLAERHIELKDCVRLLSVDRVDPRTIPCDNTIASIIKLNDATDFMTYKVSFGAQDELHVVFSWLCVLRALSRIFLSSII